MSSTVHHTAIERVDRATFERHYVGKDVPVIVEDVVTQWPAFDSWGPQYFIDKLGASSVEVAIASDSVFSYDQNRAKYRNVNMPLEQAVLSMQRSSSRDEYYYLMQKSVPDLFPSLMDDIELPTWLDEREISINFWLGSAGNFTPLHYDYLENFVAQVSGTKRWIIYSPDQLDHLHPNPKSDTYPHVSRVDISQLSQDKRLDMDGAKPVEFLLEAGEMLYLPPHWWHAVRTESLSSMINYWRCAKGLEVFLSSATGIRSFWMIYNQDLLQSIRPMVTVDDKSYLDWAEHINTIKPAAALLFAHAAIIDALLQVPVDGKTATIEEFPKHMEALMVRKTLDANIVELLERWRFLVLETFTREDQTPEEVSAKISEAREAVARLHTR